VPLRDLNTRKRVGEGELSDNLQGNHPALMMLEGRHFVNSKLGHFRSEPVEILRLLHVRMSI
jgi:hypothetical protein